MSFISTLLSHLDYPTILLLMLLESTVIPVPSELVVAPAAYHAASGELNVFLRSHRILQIERHFCSENGEYWNVSKLKYFDL